MWKDLSIQQKSEVMKMAISQGLTDLNEIKKMYDASIPNIEASSVNNTYSSVPYNPSPKDVRYDDGGWLGYLKWKDAIGKYKGIDTNDPAYDYAGFYIENPKRAWALLNDNPNAHFVDTYKTVYHPTFSDESMYSGMVSPQYNPEGLIGGSWRKYPNSFTMSTDLYRSPVSMDERIQYLENNEPEGVVLREHDGSLPMFNDGSLWGGVKPTVEVSPYAYGGPLGNIYKGTGNKSQKLSKAERENRAMWAKGQPFYKEMSLWNTGLSDVALAGILGNMGLESGFDYKATNGTHHGYLQNQDSIRDYIKKYYGGYGHKEQMQYLHDGLVGKLRGGNTSMGKQMQARFNGYIKAVANVTDPIKASQLWEQHYERSGGQAMGARQQYAKHFYDQISASGPGAFRRAKLDGTFSPIKDEKHTAYEPSINVEAPVFHTAANDLQWQPPVVASSRQEDIAPLLVQNNKPLILEPLEDTSSTSKDFSAIWDQIFPKVENTQEEFNPLLDPSTQFTALQSRPRYQTKPTPIINMPISNGDNDYMLFKPLAKGGNLFDTGSYLRNYQWRNMPETDVVYNDYNTGLPIQVGSMVWTDENGNIVTADTPNAAADYAVQYGNPTFELNIPEITIEGLGDGKSKGLVGESFEDRYARLLAAPIATNADVDNAFKEQAQWQHEQSKEKHDMDVRAADRRAYQLTPGFGTFVAAPLAATLAPIAGYELGMAALSNPYFIESLPEAIDAGTFLARSLLGLGTAGEMGLLGYDFAKYGSDAFNPWLNQNRALFKTYKDFYVLPYDVAKAGLNIYKAKSDPELAARLMVETNVDPVNSIRGIANPGSVSDNFERVIYDNSISNDSIDYIKRGGIFGLGTPQDAFLLERNKQREEFLEHKWLEGTKGDYGLVSKAVGDRNLPVYQTRPDAISRKELVPLFDTYLHPFYSDDYARLPQAYQYPTAVYLGKNGRWYGKSWDLNDYGGSGGSTTGFTGTIADLIGNPTVVTTGFQEIPEDQIEELMHSAYYTVPNIKEILTSNGK